MWLRTFAPALEKNWSTAMSEAKYNAEYRARAKYNAEIKDMSTRPAGTSLSRLGDVGNYCKRNCRWHTPKQQGAEHRKKRLHND